MPSEGPAIEQPETAESIGALLNEPDEAQEDEQEAPEGEEPQAEDAGEEGADDEQEAAEDEQDAKPDDDEEVTFERDGHEVKVKKSEIPELVEKGYDYTKKTMALADERRTLESERETIQAARAEVEKTQVQAVEDLRAISQFLEKTIGEPPPISLAQQDPSLYLIQRQQYDARKDQYQQAVQALGHASRQAETERQRKRDEKQAQTERVLNTLPGWEGKTKEKVSEVAQYLVKAGLTGELAGSAALEPSFWQIADKAMQYDALKTKSAAKPNNPPPKTAKPNSANPINTAQATRKAKFERFDKNPTLENLGALM